MPSIEGRVVRPDGTALLTHHWALDSVDAGGAWAGPSWASVLLIHGIGEHSGRYEHVGEQLARSGLDVSAYDHRGMGGSDGPRGDVDRWSTYHDDLADRLIEVRAHAAGRPVVLYGHSLGGLIVAGYLLTERPSPDLTVLTSPALDSTVPGWKQGMVRMLGGVTPGLRIPNGIDASTLSRDPSVGAKTIDDPRCVRSSSARFGREALREQERVRALAPGGFGMPTLVLHGEDDGLVPVAASAVLAGAPGVERRTYSGLRHELHNEPESAEIVDGIIGWLRAEAASVSSGPAAVAV
jgi:alpha-beta hydrolase superfamily lysophospholipase